MKRKKVTNKSNEKSHESIGWLRKEKQENW